MSRRSGSTVLRRSKRNGWRAPTGPAVGAKFRGHVKRNGKGPTYWTTCTVLECEPDHVFAFGVGPAEKPVNVWRYQLEPQGDGTDVTESFQLAQTPAATGVLGAPRVGPRPHQPHGHADHAGEDEGPGRVEVVCRARSTARGRSGQLAKEGVYPVADDGVDARLP